MRGGPTTFTSADGSRGISVNGLALTIAHVPPPLQAAPARSLPPPIVINDVVGARAAPGTATVTITSLAWVPDAVAACCSVFRRELPEAVLALRTTTLPPLASPDVAAAAVAAVRASVMAAATPKPTLPRRVLAVVNPLSGGGRAAWLWTGSCRPLLVDAGMECVEVQTAYAGHAAHIGASLAPGGAYAEYDDVIIVGGDGTLHEVVNGYLLQLLAGILERPSEASGSGAAPAASTVPATAVAASPSTPLAVEGAGVGLPPVAAPTPVSGVPGTPFDGTARSPRLLSSAIAAALEMVHRKRFAAVSGGTQNALAYGLRTTNPHHVAVCIIRGWARPLDVLLVRNGGGDVRFSLCGLGWGVPGSIAADSESHRRYLGPARYAVLKVRHAVAAGLGLQNYPATVHTAPDSSLFIAAFAADATSPAGGSDSEGGDGAAATAPVAAAATLSTIPLAALERVPHRGSAASAEGVISGSAISIAGSGSFVSEATLPGPRGAAALAGATAAADGTARAARTTAGGSTGAGAGAGAATEATGMRASPAPRSSAEEGATAVGAATARVPDDDLIACSVRCPRCNMRAACPTAETIGAFSALLAWYQRFPHLLRGRAAAVGSATPAPSSMARGGASSSALPPPLALGEVAAAAPAAASPPGLAASPHTFMASAARPLLAASASTAVATSPTAGAGTGAGAGSALAAGSAATVPTAPAPEGDGATAADGAAGAGVSVAPSAMDRALSADGVRHDSGFFIGVGIANVTPDARFGHASDGALDVILARRGNVVQTGEMLIRYALRIMGVGDERFSVLYEYRKAQSAIILPGAAAATLGCNVDGEVLPGPGPFAVAVCASLLSFFGMP